MKPLTEQSYYELLEVAPDASSDAIESAFDRAMQFYGPGSLATYTLADGAEAHKLVERIEEAYLTLSDPELRRAYDERNNVQASPGAAPHEPRKAPRPRGQLTLQPIVASAGQYPWPGSRPDADRAGPAAADASQASPAQLLQEAAAAAEPAGAAAGTPAPAEEARPETSAPASEARGPEASGELGEPVEIADSEVVLIGGPPVSTEDDPLISDGDLRTIAAAAREAAARAQEALDDAAGRPAEPAALEAKPIASEPAASAAVRVTDAPACKVEETPREEPPAEPAPLPPKTATAAAVDAAVVAPREPVSEPASGQGAALALANRSASQRHSHEPRPEPAAPRHEERRQGPRAAPKPVPRMPDLPPHTVFSGEMLRRVREGRGLSVRELAERTKIGAAHIEAIEADHYEALPVPVYLRGFLMLVARELRLDPLKVSKSYLELVARASGK